MRPQKQKLRNLPKKKPRPQNPPKSKSNLNPRT